MAVLLVRHADAGDRDKWEGDDDLRPLSETGRRHALGLVGLLADRPITRVLSSPSLRCIQTVEPLADERGLKVELTDALLEGVDEGSVVGLARSVAGEAAVLCTHGDVIPTLLDALARTDGLVLGEGYPCAKGSTWVLEVDEHGRFAGSEYLPPPA